MTEEITFGWSIDACYECYIDNCGGLEWQFTDTIGNRNQSIFFCSKYCLIRGLEKHLKINKNLEKQYEELQENDDYFYQYISIKNYNNYLMMKLLFYQLQEINVFII